MSDTTELISAVRALLRKLRHCQVCEVNIATHIGDDGCDDDDCAVCDTCELPKWGSPMGRIYDRSRPPEICYAKEIRDLDRLLPEEL